MLVSFMAYLAALKGLTLSDEDISLIDNIERVYCEHRNKPCMAGIRDIIAVLEDLPGGLDKAYVRQMYKQYKRIQKKG